MKHTVLKIGHSVVVDKNNQIKPDGIEAVCLLVNDIAGGNRSWPTIITTGAVACGLAALPHIKLDSSIIGNNSDLSLKQTLAAVGQPRLINLYQRYLNPHSLKGAQILLSQHDLLSIEAADTFVQTHSRLTDLAAVPIINENDTLANEAFRDDNLDLALGVAEYIKPTHVIAIEDTDQDLYTEVYFGNYLRAFRNLGRYGTKVIVAPFSRIYDIGLSVNVNAPMPGDQII